MSTPSQIECAVRRERKTARKWERREALQKARTAFLTGKSHGKLFVAQYIAANPHKKAAVVSRFATIDAEGSITLNKVWLPGQTWPVSAIIGWGVEQ